MRTEIAALLHKRSGSIPRETLIEIGLLHEFAQNHRLDVWTVPLVATVIAVVAASWAGPVPMLVWWFLFSSALILSHRDYSALIATVGRLDDPRPWQRRMLWLRLGTASLWSCLVLFAWPGASDPARNVLLLVLSCAMALRTAGSTAFAQALVMQMLPPLLALLALCLSTAEPVYGGMAVVAVVYAAVLGRIGLRTAGRMREMLRLQFDLQDATAAAETANDAKSRFLATLSHEIRTPMTGILGLTRVLLESDLTARQRDYLRTVHDSGEGLLALLNEVLDLSKVEAGRLDLEAAAFDPRSLVEGVVRLMSARAEEKGLYLNADMTGSLPLRLTGDALRLRQVLTNLVANAVKFTETGGVTITLRAEAADGDRTRLGIMVSDTGIGIPQTAQGRLFTAFAQADPGIARRYGGSGLGLTICQRLIQAMGGEMGFHSSPDQGSDFWFTVTLAHAADADEERLEVLSPLPALSLLVAEDVAANRMVLTALLEGAGHRVTCVSSGPAAVAAVEQGDFDLVLMDLHLEGSDGVDAARAIRVLPDPARAAVPIIATTAGVMAADVDRCRAAGMDGFVPKPVRPSQLFAEILAVWTRDRGRAGTDPVQTVLPLPETTEDVLASLHLPPAELAELLDLSGAALRQAGLDLMAAWPVRDAAALRRAAHMLTGTAANFGLPQLAEEARCFHAALQQQDWDGAERLYRTLPETLTRSLTELERWRPVPAPI